ncbi:MAG: type II toxin-antitoxin system VapC family toxin [Tepidisphaeraceae bacterium]
MPEQTVLYFDSALIAKFYLNEPGRRVIRDLTRSAGRVVSSAIAVAEVSSAFHRKLREGAVNAEAHAALQGQFAHDVRAGVWGMIPITDVLLENVRTLFSRLGSSAYLRSLDALHVITAKAERFDQIHSNDRHLLAACAGAGLIGVNPLG